MGVFEIDSEDLDRTADLSKMEFIQNKIFAYTERQDVNEDHKNFKVTIMSAFQDVYQDSNFVPFNAFKNDQIESNTDGIKVIPTEKVVPHARDISELTFGIPTKVHPSD